ncbi:DUF3558 domain-containing protein [Actinosynnema sp. NPDC051121]|nr:DUF3558 domain-containing protein [Saccharothrix sp.]
MSHPTTRLAITAGLALLTTACAAAGTTGSAGPASTTSSMERTSPTPSTGRGHSALADLKPCDLLTPAEVGQLGLTHPGEEDQVGGADTCLWKVRGNGNASAAIRPEQGIGDLDYAGDRTVPTTIGKYPATRVEAPLDAKYICHVVISVTESSSVQVIATIDATSTDTAAACERATKTAELIAPKLP